MHTPDFFKGYTGFRRVMRNERIAIPGRVIRVYNYGATSGNEKQFVLGPHNEWYDVETQQRVSPKKVFSEHRAPDGCSVEGLAAYLLPDEALQELLDNV